MASSIKTNLRRNHHFFLFRHCVRSTSTTIRPLAQGNDQTFPPNPAEYVDAPLPDWQVPENWCTPQGQDIARNMGRWLLESGKIQGRAIHFEFISDQSFRDVDTAFQISQGLMDYANESSAELETLTLDGVNEQTYLSGLFHPFESGHFPAVEEAICTPMYTDDDLISAALHRMHNTSKPSLSMDQALELIQQLAGVGSFGKLQDRLPLDENHTEALLVAANFISYMAEVFYYSRAGGILPPFVPETTVAQVYSLLQWHFYTRSVVYMENPQSATQGAVWAQVMMRVLRSGYFWKLPPIKDYDTYVTIVAGHDGNLNELATALGVTWDMMPPYESSGGDALPTPPLTGIHAHYTTDGELSMHAIYPVYSQQTPAGQDDRYWQTNTSGIMEHAAFLFPHGQPTYFETVGDITVVQGEDKLGQLGRHIEGILSQYEGASECYKNAAAFQQQYSPASKSWTVALGVALTGCVVGMILLVCLWRCCCCRSLATDATDEERVKFSDSAATEGQAAETTLSSGDNELL